MSSHHERLVCSCGSVIRQCRCPAPKTDQLVENGCKQCKEALAVAPRFVAPTYRPRRILGECRTCTSGLMSAEVIQAAEDRHLDRISPEHRARALQLMDEYDTPYHEIGLAMTREQLLKAKEMWEGSGSPPDAFGAEIDRMLGYIRS
jgi:hypothetical protein